MSVRQFIQNAKTQASELINGKTLEATIVDVLRKEGYQDVRTNVTLQSDKVTGTSSQIDIVAKKRSLVKRFLHISPVVPYGNGTLYIDCKQQSPKVPVQPNLVSEFKKICQANKISERDALFIALSTFTPEAKQLGIKTVNQKTLIKWTRHKAKSQWFTLFIIFAATAIIAVTTTVRGTRLQCTVPATSFLTTEGCRSHEAPLLVTRAKTEDLAPWKPFLAFEFRPPLPVEETARQEAKDMIDARLNYGRDYSSWKWLQKRYLWHNHRGRDYLIVCIPKNRLPSLRRHALTDDMNVIVDGYDEMYHISAQVPHWATVPGYYMPHMRYLQSRGFLQRLFHRE